MTDELNHQDDQWSATSQPKRLSCVQKNIFMIPTKMLLLY